MVFDRQTLTLDGDLRHHCGYFLFNASTATCGKCIDGGSGTTCGGLEFANGAEFRYVLFVNLHTDPTECIDPGASTADPPTCIEPSVIDINVSGCPLP